MGAPIGELAACRVCGLVQDTGRPASGEAAVCPRCGAEVYRRKKDSVRRTLAFSIGALFLYIPANVFPLVTVYYSGKTNSATLWSSVHALFQTGNYGVGCLLFTTSIATPALKLLSLLFLCLMSGSPRWQKQRTFLYGTIELVNPWNMLEMFMVSLLVGIVKFGEIALIVPGAGALCFGSLVALTILASESYDSRLIWDVAPEPAPAGRAAEASA